MTALDAAFERLAASGFELPNGFVNHGPMACEALDTLGLTDEIEPWAERFSHVDGVDAVPVEPSSFDAPLGAYNRLPEWLGYFDAVIRTDGWADVVEKWVPQLMPALSVALFHGAIRVAHATRAISEADTPARRVELARALGYWAARYKPGAPPPVVEVASVPEAVLETATVAAHRYLADPDIFTLHGVTGAMAVELLVPHLDASAGLAALAQLEADHHAFFGDAFFGPPPDEAVGAVDVVWDDVATSAASSRDPHQVKLVEACRRGWAATHDATFTAAAAHVITTRGRPPRLR